MALATAELGAASPVAGSWVCVSTNPDSDDLHWTLTVNELDGKLNASLVMENGDDWKLTKLKFDGKVLSFIATLESEDYTVTLNVDGDKMEGKWAGGGENGKITGGRQKQ